MDRIIEISFAYGDRIAIDRQGNNGMLSPVSSTSDWEKIEEALNSLDRPNSYEKLWDVGDVEVQDNYLESVSFIKKQSE